MNAIFWFRKHEARQFITFLLVGGSFAAIYAGIASLCMAYFTEQYWQASAIGYSATIFPAYLAQKNLSFKQAGAHGSALPKYIVLQILAVALSSLLSQGLGSFQALPPPVVFLTTSAITSIFTYLSMRFIVFPKVAL